ncbi:heat shock protein HtpX [Posidoniimonas polymericola]|uniref:Heat shock protein HtpX n=1 Tax=Posidoniimonas polymericola TaxID=2528002 RepID=A0A5C5YRH5_9BACT|nr:M48 family metalloprotease [Posidoniimonas polymericola]TWT77489.1 heat shock protein HtpX [Posidoniimonas polymericola]
MPIQVVCPGCSAAFRAPEKAIGRQAACPKCSSAITISAPTTSSRRAASPGPAKSPQKKQRARLTPESVAAAIEGPIEPVRTTLTYRLGILLSLATMLLMPLVYAALIAGACYLVYLHAVTNTGIFESVRGRAVMYAFLAYLAPLVAGPVMILFMIKPLFASPARHQKTRSLRRESEPVLFAFVDSICETVGSARPKRIDIDCQVNASAGFRKGVVSMLGNDLVLTIGMPLAAGLTARQLGGVLAHEFGHFTQGAGMRLTYLVRSISHWFVRVVYERDSWDEWLATTASSLDIRLGWVLWLAMLAVWLTRKILWVLLHLGTAVAGFTLRQMEFDADRYEARFAGSETFASTARRLQELNAGQQMAFAQLSASHQEGRLVDDLPALVTLNASRLPQQTQTLIKQGLEKSETGLFATHPCDKDRIASAMAEQSPGVFQLDAPASELFRDFAEQAKAASWEFYRDVFGNRVDKSALTSVDELHADHRQQEAADHRLSGYFQQVIRAYRPTPIGSGFLTPPKEPKKVLAELKAGRQAFESGAEAARDSLKKYDQADSRLMEALVYEAYHSARIRVDKKSVEKCFHSREAAKDTQQRCVRKMGAANAELANFDQVVAKRLRSAVDLLQVDQVAGRLQDGRSLRSRTEKLVPALVAIDGQMETLRGLCHANVMLGALIHQMQSAGEASEEMVAAADRIVDRVRPKVSQLREVLSRQSYPFKHKDPSVSLGAYVLPTPPNPRDLGGVIDAISEVSEGTITVRRRVLGELATIAEQVESLVGCPPLPPLPDADERPNAEQQPDENDSLQ